MDRRTEGRVVIRWMMALSIGALFISVSTSIAVLLFMIGYGQELAKRDSRIDVLEGKVEARLQMEGSLRMEIQTWQAHVSSLRMIMAAQGLAIPDTPETE